MAYIKPQGSPTAKVWVVVEQPYPQDAQAGYVWSAGYGRMFNSMMQAVGIRDYYVLPRRPDLDHPDTYTIIETDINQYQPPIIIPIEEAGTFFCRELIKNEFSKRKLSQGESEISKYAGSILTSPFFNYPHYIIPTLAPDTVMKQYKLKDIVTYLDLGKVSDELTYFTTNGTLQPLPQRTLKYNITDFEELNGYLDRFNSARLLSNDIETVYPKNKASQYWGHPGLPTCVGLADSKDFGISFELFQGEDRVGITRTRHLWRRLQAIFERVDQLGQNFFNFDLPRYEMLGFRIDRFRCHDTLIRQHILWPELEKSLQFMTRQYTREPYYKDEGHGWSFKDMRRLKRYNCLDVCVTMEVFEAQQKEFEKRPYLLGGKTA
ncbi:MAG TPA: hypothetical protein VGF75_04405 [Candidatus Saccharimonadales bacterium]|jgi:hypothetical protein